MNHSSTLALVRAYQLPGLDQELYAAWWPQLAALEAERSGRLILRSVSRGFCLLCTVKAFNDQHMQTTTKNHDTQKLPAAVCWPELAVLARFIPFRFGFLLMHC